MSGNKMPILVSLGGRLARSCKAGLLTVFPAPTGCDFRPEEACHSVSCFLDCRQNRMDLVDGDLEMDPGPALFSTCCPMMQRYRVKSEKLGIWNTASRFWIVSDGSNPMTVLGPHNIRMLDLLSSPQTDIHQLGTHPNRHGGRMMLWAAKQQPINHGALIASTTITAPAFQCVTVCEKKLWLP